MSDKPFFSIVIPTLNSAATISSCLISVTSQTFSQFEVLVIDGDSKDETIKLIEDFEDERIIIFSEKDSGIYDAMNKGIRNTQGNWVYFLGSDDKFYSKYILSNVRNYILNSTADVIYGNVTSPVFNGIYGGEYTARKLYDQNICHQAIFYKRELFNKIGKYNTKYRIFADYDFNIRWFLKNNIKKLYINEIIAEYAADGISSKQKDDLFLIDKSYRFMINGIGSLPTSFIIELCKKGHYEFFKNLVMKIVATSLRIYRKIYFELSFQQHVK